MKNDYIIQYIVGVKNTTTEEHKKKEVKNRSEKKIM